MNLKLAAAVFTLTALAVGARADAPPTADALWSAPLWLTSQAFGLEQDCPVAVLFQEPHFRPIALPRGGAASSRLASADRYGDELVLTVDMMQLDGHVQRVTLELHLHPTQGIVSVEHITIGDAGQRRISLRYEDAVDDDEEYDLYTDTLVSVYTTLFDTAMIKERVRRTGPATPAGS